MLYGGGEKVGGAGMGRWEEHGEGKGQVCKSKQGSVHGSMGEGRKVELSRGYGKACVCSVHGGMAGRQQAEASKGPQ